MRKLQFTILICASCCVLLVKRPIENLRTNGPSGPYQQRDRMKPCLKIFGMQSTPFASCRFSSCIFPLTYTCMLCSTCTLWRGPQKPPDKEKRARYHAPRATHPPAPVPCQRTPLCAQQRRSYERPASEELPPLCVATPCVCRRCLGTGKRAHDWVRYALSADSGCRDTAPRSCTGSPHTGEPDACTPLPSQCNGQPHANAHIMSSDCRKMAELRHWNCSLPKVLPVIVILSDRLALSAAAVHNPRHVRSSTYSPPGEHASHIYSLGKHCTH